MRKFFKNLLITIGIIVLMGMPFYMIYFFTDWLPNTDFYQNRFIEKKAISKVLSIRNNFIFDTTYFDDEYEQTGQKDTLGNMTYIKSYVVDTSHEVIYKDLIKDKIDSFKESNKYPEYYSKIGEVEYIRNDILLDFLGRLGIGALAIFGGLSCFFIFLHYRDRQG